MFSTTYLDQLGLCRLCLIKEKVQVSIFEDDENFPEIPLKINTCLPVKVKKEDNLPKKICVDCYCKLESFYQFYNVTEKAEKQLLTWLQEEEMENKEEISLSKKLMQKNKSNESKEKAKHEEEPNLIDPNISVKLEDSMEVINKEVNDSHQNSTHEILFKKDESSDDWANNDNSDFEEEMSEILEVSIKTDKNVKKIKKKSGVKKNEKEQKQKNLRRKNYFHKIAGRIYCERLGKRKIACTECNEIFELQKDVRSHFKSKHVEQQIFKCDQCDQTFPKLCKFKLHRKEHGIDMNAPVFYCDKCNYKSTQKYYYEAHYARRHSEDAKFECDHCGKKYKLKEDLRFHIGVHDESQHMCDICGRFYPTPRILSQHRRVKHVNIYNFRCSVCGFKFVSQQNLDTHTLEMHNPENPHKCDECGQQFQRRYYLSRHKRRVHKKLEKPYLCTVCGKSFVCMNTYRIHYLTHTKIKPYVCNVCGDTFSQRTSMMLHWRKKHPDAGDPPPPVILTNVFEALQLDQGDNSLITN